MKTNFHTHHELCRHAGGTCEDYVQEALRLGMEQLGFSDHAPFDRKDLGFRMFDRDLATYIKDIKDTKKKYKDRLTIFGGIEIEHWYQEDEYYEQFLTNFDYLILGQHFVSLKKDDQNLISSFGLSTKEQIYAYADTLCDAMKTKRYKIIAHPELYMHGYKDFDEHAAEVAHRIAKCASETNTILEFNANGYRREKMDTPQGFLHPYPRMEFWDIIKQYEVRTILSSDAHNPSLLYDDTMKEAEEIFDQLPIQKVYRFEEF